MALELETRQLPSLGLYVHVPFCRVRCPFCPFYVQVHRERAIRLYLDALKRELHFYAKMPVFQGVPISTVYIGGGTPTTLAIAELQELLGWIRNSFPIMGDTEVSIEAHPGTVSGGGLKDLLSAGVNRLSLGIQSFDTQELKSLGGRILAGEASVMVEEARSAGFQNINLDLMYGFPGHTLQAWQHTLDMAIRSVPEHLSCYAFTVEEGTQVQDDISRGVVPMPDGTFQLRLEEEALQKLAESGYERYEISNFCRPGRACRHNLRYWRGDAYLGLGPSAQSYVGGVRFGNIPDLQSYQRILLERQLPLDTWEPLTEGQIEREEVVFGLRLTKGVPLHGLSVELQVDEGWNRGVQSMREKGFLNIKDGYLRLTPTGIQYADTVAVALL